MLSVSEKNLLKDELLNTERALPRSTLFNFLEMNGEGSPKRFADNPGFECPQEFKDALSELFDRGQKKYEIPDGAWIAQLKLQIDNEVERGTISTRDQGKARIKDLFKSFTDSISLDAKNLLNCDSNQLTVALKEKIRLNFSNGNGEEKECKVAPRTHAESKETKESALDNLKMKKMLADEMPKLDLILSDVNAFFNNDSTKTVMEKYLGVNSVAKVTNLLTTLRDKIVDLSPGSAVSRAKKLMAIIGETAKALKDYNDPQYVPMIVFIGEVLLNACDQYKKNLDPNLCINYLVSQLRGIKNATKPRMLNRLFKSEHEQEGSFSNTIREILRNQFPNYKSVTQTKPDKDHIQGIINIHQNVTSEYKPVIESRIRLSA